jgi:GT2 family glycosyltransferase
MITISVVVPVFNGANSLRRCLEALGASTVKPLECIVVDDGSTDNSVEVAKRFGARVIRTGRQMGPAKARNVGAKAARGEIVLFIDSDVCVTPSTIERLKKAFLDEPGVAAVFGSYDDTSPEGFFSEYKNLQHAYVHRSARREASTFWTGCGAVRKDIFLALGGFQEAFGRPCIEDIEFGGRLVKCGQRVIVDGSIRVQHLKEYQFRSMVRSDIIDRAIPWTKLILRDKQFPNTLNLNWSQRVAAGAVCAFLLTLVGVVSLTGLAVAQGWIAILFFSLTSCMVDVQRRHRITPLVVVVAVGCLALLVGAWWQAVWMAPALLLYRLGAWRKLLGVWAMGGAALAVAGMWAYPLAYAPLAPLSLAFMLNWQFYWYVARQKGLLFATSAVAVHLLYYLYSMVGFAAGLASFYWQSGRSAAADAGAVTKSRDLPETDPVFSKSRGIAAGR